MADINRLAAGPLFSTVLSLTISGCGGAPPEAPPVPAGPPSGPPDPIYDEALVPEYVLPSPLVTDAGGAVTRTGDWEAVRRPEILDLFSREVYGISPPEILQIRAEVRAEDSGALGGLAIRREVRLHLTSNPTGVAIDVLLYTPRRATGPVPVFLGLNFYGNQSVDADPGITISDEWMRQNEEFGIVENRATEATRGVRASRWPVEEILRRGYGLATVYYGDIDPDFDDGFRNGVHALFRESEAPGPDAWGSISAWAWGLSRVMDYLIIDASVDGTRVAVVGHSRLGKAALWAGALDTRFALVVSNNSGAGGAALSMRRFGETVEAINTNFPHWFSGNFKQYNRNEDALPVDQHMLLSLIAPRPLYVASAQGDEWADPKGEFLAALGASPVYALYGEEGLPTADWPLPAAPVMGTIGYHVRPGPHDLTAYDWGRFMDFADMHLRP